MSQHILVPFDGSGPATEAAEYAIETFPDAEITLLRVLVPAEDFDSGVPVSVYGYSTGDPDDVERDLERAKASARESFEPVQELADQAGVELETAVWIGSAVPAIVEFVEDNDVDQIVIGSHGRRGLSRVLLGSVAERVARRSPVPVTITR